jgi:hypothetical protein
VSSPRRRVRAELTPHLSEQASGAVGDPPAALEPGAEQKSTPISPPFNPQQRQPCHWSRSVEAIMLASGRSRLLQDSPLFPGRCLTPRTVQCNETAAQVASTSPRTPSALRCGRCVTIGPPRSVRAVNSGLRPSVLQQCLAHVHRWPVVVWLSRGTPLIVCVAYCQCRSSSRPVCCCLHSL